MTEILQTFSKYSVRGVEWIQTHYPTAIAHIKTGTWKAYEAVHTHLWPHRVNITKGVAAVAAAIFGYYYWKSLPMKPHVKFSTCLNHGRFEVSMPKNAPVKPNVNLIFCVDTSGSMRDHGRVDAVKRALHTLVSNAQAKIKNSGASIAIAIAGFSSEATVLLKPTELSATDTSDVTSKINVIQCNGETKIFEGLRCAQNVLTQMVRTKPQAKHTVILLTDGGDTVYDRDLASLNQLFQKVQAQVYAIGIADHNSTVLKNISARLQGTYIDTSKTQNTIESSINTIYQQTLSSYQDLELSSSLKGNCWSVQNHQIGVCRLGSLSEGTTIDKVITIHGESLLEESVDLATVTFTLSYIDPVGKKGRITLPWDPHFFIIRDFMRRIQGAHSQ